MKSFVSYLFLRGGVLIILTKRKNDMLYSVIVEEMGKFIQGVKSYEKIRQVCILLL